MSDNIIQTSFAAGELAPSLYAHVDLAKYKSGAAVMRNFFVDYRSGASTRAGMRYIIQALNSSKPVRLIPYQFSSTVSYIIEFGDFYCRFITESGVVLETAVNITGITQAFPAAVATGGNSFNVGDWVYIQDAGGMVQINNRFFQVRTAGATITLNDLNGNPVDARAYDAYTSGGTIARVYQIASPYAAEDLASLKFVQSASQMTLTHPSYAPRTLVATAPTSWAFTTITFGSSVSTPTGLAGAASSGTGSYYSYAVSAVDSNGQESQAAVAAVDNVLNLSTTAGSITLTWNAVTGADHYRLYKAEFRVGAAVPLGTAYGFIGFSNSTSFVDSNIVPDFTVTPPIADNPFDNNNHPIAFSYFQQRASYGGSTAFPLTLWMSRPGNFNNFDFSNPSQEDDAITAPLISLQLNAIQSLVPMPGGLIAFTSRGAWQVSGGSAGAGGEIGITPINAVATPQDGSRARPIQPIVVVDDILYTQARAVRNLNYNLNTNIYRGSDISILSNHLLFYDDIVEWAYAEEPFKIVWCVRDDGVLLSLTYVKEQEVYGWARHDTYGLFKSVAVVTESTRDAVYVVVERPIGVDGAWVKTIERMDDRQFTYGNYNPTNEPGLPIPYIRGNAESAWCVDCGVQSALPTPDAELTATTSVGDVVFEADAAVFSSSNVGDVIRMGGGVATITAFVTAMIVNATWSISPSKIVPNGANVPIPAPSGEWSLTTPFNTFYGLDHLEGQTVSILADGGVVAPQVVTNGSVTLENEATLVTVGLAFEAQLQTMYLDLRSNAEGTVQGKRKKIAALSIRASNSRGLKAGNTFGTVTPVKELSPNVQLGQPIPLISNDEYFTLDPLWSVEGQICLQQNDPLPATVLGVIPEIVIGDS